MRNQGHSHRLVCVYDSVGVDCFFCRVDHHPEEDPSPPFRCTCSVVV